MPNDLDNKKIPNTQKDDLIPFFAKNYSSSSESKEDICFINSPIPSNSNTYTGGEAEEVEGIEEDDKEDKSELSKNNNNKNINSQNNDELGQSIDYNSEIEA